MRGQVPVLANRNRNDRLNIKRVPFTDVTRTDVVIIVVLKGHVDQRCDRVVERVARSAVAASACALDAMAAVTNAVVLRVMVLKTPAFP